VLTAELDCIMYICTGAVTYRVVQVAPQDGSDPQSQVVTAGFPAGAQVKIITFTFHMT